MTTNFVAKGTEFIKKAVIADNAEDYQEALNLYTQGIQYLLTGVKYEKNPRLIDAVKSKVIKYLKRAEEIKNSLSNPPPKKKRKMKARAGGNDDNDDDKDVTKLKSGLSSAIIMEKPNVKWSDVAGLETAKALLKEAVILPIKFPQLFTGKRKPWKGILLYGPPGTGKSYLAKAVASEANNSTFFSVSSSDLISKYVGESEKLIKYLFKMARTKKPSIIFIDEIDSLATKRNDNEQDSTRRVKTELLIQMEGVGKTSDGVLILGATNCPWDLDPAVRRRFVKRIYISLPNNIARCAMFKIHVGSNHGSNDNPDIILNDRDYDILASKTKGFSGSDIAGICQDALMEPVRTLQKATHFRKIILNNIDNDDDDNKNDNDNNDDNDTNYIWMPCSPAHPNGIKISLMEFDDNEQNKIKCEPLKLSHFLRILHNSKPSVGKEDIQKNIKWTQDYGQDG